ncbi:HNH endonuclease [Micromonospora sp. DT201]|uniref:HNH endonuclease n=1 Tax=Micromonospora sp. DT201 TaxID=3393442 RepID=UPI003CEDC084
MEEDVVRASTTYAAAAAEASIHSLVDSAFSLSAVSAKEMVGVYEGRMAKKGSAGRFIYDELMLAAKHGRCPLCGQRSVSTLDHHLPKSSFPALAVDPLNLVPACSDCNKAKSSSIPVSRHEETLHPYFDDIEKDLWLRARVVEVGPAALIFFVDHPVGWTEIMFARASLHFKTFGLSGLYSSQAAQELNNIRFGLSQIFDRGGEAVVKQHLREQAVSRSAAHTNSWQAATYRALAENEWFCRGGFEFAY